METKKYTNKLQKSSVLFLQLGLVLTLLTTYFAFELKTEQRTVDFERPKIEIEKPYVIATIVDFQIEEEIVKKSKRITETQPLDDVVIDDTLTKDDAPPITQADPLVDNPVGDGLVDVDDPEPFIEDVPEVPYTSIQEVPIFPGCEKVIESKRRACFDKKMSKHIQRKFNGDLHNQLGLSSGVQKIFVQFLITKTGDIEVINARAPHKKLMNEGKRVVKNLPRMIPGKQNGKEVNVRYTLPITFEVE